MNVPGRDWTERAAAIRDRILLEGGEVYADRASFVWGQRQGPTAVLYMAMDDIVDRHLLNLERMLSGRGRTEYVRGFDDRTYSFEAVYGLVLAEIAQRGLEPLGEAHEAARSRTSGRTRHGAA